MQVNLFNRISKIFYLFKSLITQQPKIIYQNALSIVKYLKIEKKVNATFILLF